MNLKDAQVIQANYRFWQALGAELADFDEAICLITNLPYSESNKIFIKNPDRLTEQGAKRLVDFFKEKNVPHIWLVPTSAHDPQIQNMLKSHGFLPSVCLPSMMRDVSTIEAKESSAHVEEIKSLEELERVNSIWQKSFHVPERAGAKHLAFLQNYYNSGKKNVRFYLAYKNDVPVGTGWLFLDTTHASIYNIATSAESRNQGVAQNVMQKLVEEALHLGYHTIMLSALGPAKNIYERLGFYTVGEHVVYKKVARTGIEPATQGFSVLCSTD
jgi:ribosomal protein S18 acetylase RimI-like enzyme